MRSLALRHRLCFYRVAIFLLTFGLLSLKSKSNAIDCGSGVLTSGPEYRGLWVTRFEWPLNGSETGQKSKIDTITSAAREANFNSVFFQVRGQCDVLYPSPNEPWGSQFGWTDPGYDPVAYAIDSAHERGMEFHAYINTHTIHQTNQANPQPPPASVAPPNEKPHPYFLHGNPSGPNSDWCYVSSDGTTQALGIGESGYIWAAPGVPSFMQWEREQILYVANTYDVDGVHFDRIRFSGTGSHDAISLARYNGRGNPMGLSFQNWSRDQLTRFLNDVYGAVAEVNANRPQGKRLIKVSTAPFRAPSQQLSVNQDVGAWNSLGAQDFFVPQIYVNSASTFETHALANLGITNGRHLVCGLDRTIAGSFCMTQAQVLIARSVGSQGAVSFSYSGFGGELSSFAVNAYGNYVEPPDMPWLTNPTDAIIIGNVTDGNGNPVLDAWLERPSETQYKWLSGNDGFYAMLKIPVGQSVSITASHPDFTPATVHVNGLAAGEVRRVNIVLSDSLGYVELDKEYYKPGDEVAVTLLDADLEGNGTATVLATSLREPAGEVVELTESGTGGRFTGNFQLNDLPEAIAGKLEVNAFDTITVTYEDADNGSGQAVQATATAISDSVTPQLVDVSISPIGATSAVINISTDEPTRVVLNYGTSCELLSESVAENTPSTDHSINLTALSVGTAYRFEIILIDQAGNEVTHNANGQCYQFETLELPVGLVEDCNSGAGEWTGDGLWHHVGENDPCTSANSAPGAWYYGTVSCNYNTGSRTSGRLVSPEFIVPADAELRFASREHTESLVDFDQKHVKLQVDGVDVPISQVFSVTDEWYDVPAIDLSAHAGAIARLVFEFDSIDGFFNDQRGWYVDDIQLLSRAPTANIAMSPSTITEGTVARLDGQIVDSDTNDTYTILVNWGDGSPVETLLLPPLLTQFAALHTYRDDNPTSTVSDQFLVSTVIIGQDGKSGSGETTIRVDNVSPVTGQLDIRSSINEGEGATLFLEFNDPGSNDTFEAAVNWGVGEEDEHFLLGPGSSFLFVTHPYEDDTPSGTPMDESVISVSLRDDDLGECPLLTGTVTVHNAVPFISFLEAPEVIFEGDNADVSGEVFDAGVRDTHDVQIDWGDGSIVQHEAVEPVSRTFSNSHIYQDNGIRQLALTVMDDDGDASDRSLSIEVLNRPPVLGTLNAQAGPGELVTLTGTFSDAGAMDTFNVQISWGDGNTDLINLTAGSTEFVATHEYTNTQEYTIHVDLTDDDGGNTSGEISIQADADPRADLSLSKTVTPDPVSLGSPLTYGLLVTNLGPDEASNVIVSDNLPGGVTLCGDLPNVCALEETTVTCALGSLTAGTSASLELCVIPAATGLITNMASVISDSVDEVTDNNLAIVSSMVGEKPDGPDLTGTFDQVVGSCHGLESARCVVRGKLISSNIGNENARRSVLRVYLSDNAVLDSDDQILARRTVRLRAGTSRSVRFTLARREDQLSGKYLILVMDDGNAIPESNETNNVSLVGPMSLNDLQ